MKDVNLVVSHVLIKQLVPLVTMDFSKIVKEIVYMTVPLDFMVNGTQENVQLVLLLIVIIVMKEITVNNVLMDMFSIMKIPPVLILPMFLPDISLM